MGRIPPWAHELRGTHELGHGLVDVETLLETDDVLGRCTGFRERARE